MKRKFYGIEKNKKIFFDLDKYYDFSSYSYVRYGYHNLSGYKSLLNKLRMIYSTLQTYMDNDNLDVFIHYRYVDEAKLIISDDKDIFLNKMDKVRLNGKEGVILDRIYDVENNLCHYYTDIYIDTGTNYITDQDRVETFDYAKKFIQDELLKFKKLIETKERELEEKEIAKVILDKNKKKENKLMKKLKELFQNPLQK